MKRFWQPSLLILALLGASLALGATVYNKFQPATGVLKGSTATYVTTAATSADVIGLWSGTCNSSALLNGAGGCTAIPTAGAALTTGTWTSSLTTGCTTNASVAFAYSLISTGTGAIVTVDSQSASSCTANSGAWHTAAGSVPAAVRPTRTIHFPSVSGTDGGVSVGMCMYMDADGTLGFLKLDNTTHQCGASTFGASGVRAVDYTSTAAGNASGDSTFTYRID